MVAGRLPSCKGSHYSRHSPHRLEERGVKIAVAPVNPREYAVCNILPSQAPVGEVWLIELNVVEELVLEVTRQLVLFGSLAPVAVDAGLIRVNQIFRPPEESEHQLWIEETWQ